MWLVMLLGGKLRASIIGISIIIIGYGYFYVKAAAYRDGKDAGRIEAYKTEKSKVETEMASERTRIAQERSDLAKALTAFTAERNALQTQRRDITATLNRGLSEIAARDVEIRNEISDTVDADVDSRFRTALARARAADSRLAAIRTAKP